MSGLSTRLWELSQTIWKVAVLLYVPFGIFTIVILPMTDWEVGVSDMTFMGVFAAATVVLLFLSMLRFVKLMKDDRRTNGAARWRNSRMSKLMGGFNKFTGMLLLVFVLLVIIFAIL